MFLWGEGMSRIDSIHKICFAVICEDIISKNDMENRSICGPSTDYKSGIYFLYDNENEVIYVGMVGNAPNTSLYDRMCGHGSGSHKMKESRWYSEVIFGRFHKFDNLDDCELRKIERLAIFGM